MDNPFENLNTAIKQVIVSLDNLHKAFYQVQNNECYELIKLVGLDEFNAQKDFFYLVPEEYNKYFVGLIFYGCSFQQAFEILKETYKF